MQLGLQSEFWRNLETFMQLAQQLNLLVHLPSNWAAYPADPPNELARRNAELLLSRLERSRLAPRRLSAIMDGGVGILFASGAKRALIEAYNNGEIVVATYSDAASSDVWMMSLAEGEELSASATIDKIRVYLAD